MKKMKIEEKILLPEYNKITIGFNYDDDTYSEVSYTNYIDCINSLLHLIRTIPGSGIEYTRTFYPIPLDYEIDDYRTSDGLHSKDY